MRACARVRALVTFIAYNAIIRLTYKESAAGADRTAAVDKWTKIRTRYPSRNRPMLPLPKRLRNPVRQHQLSAAIRRPSRNRPTLPLLKQLRNPVRQHRLAAGPSPPPCLYIYINKISR